MRGRAGRDDGFTVMELLFVVAILGILVSIAVVSYITATGSARDVTCRNNQRALQESVPIYMTEHDAAPAALEDLRPYVTDFDTVTLCPNRDGTTLQYDPATRTVSCPNHP